MVRYPDFLRHIVNTKLSELSHKYRELAGHLDEVRKEISKAEPKYEFSSFGGNPENLANYLLSDDFNLLISSFKAANAIKVLEEILVEAKKAYSELPNVVKAIDTVLEKIRESEKGAAIVSHTSLKDLALKIENILKELKIKADIKTRDNDIVLSIPNKGSIVIKPYEANLETIISITTKIKPEKLEEILKKASEILNLEEPRRVAENKEK
ncbi:hypothetical protein [Staphylothermus hellenicus]|uniref:Uncharacterized protein n=1 Tax=Staphylothermus hellenicus (strain DSM 12710 / JCM 10830 / BK20S6-10-b1 / P8) TaxID=591019 RepID=D7DB65_STAHD|nr:hypothetical protein [Staphylothermus hellenicus]ADI31412.1 hypothetical protein Shell_0274 [Staphylothermus hellenicus DSM 12710]